MQEPNYTHITKRMKQLRKESNYTQEQIADALNCTPAYISNVENNRAKLNLRLLSYYSKLCGVPLEYFLDSEPSTYAQPKVEIVSNREEEIIDKELSDLLRTFTISEKKKIIDILKIYKSN